jgi:hypothetical protein
MRSFIPYSETSDFPIENLPYGVFSTAGNVRYTTYIITARSDMKCNMQLQVEMMDPVTPVTTPAKSNSLNSRPCLSI